MGKLFDELKNLKAQYDKKLKKDGEAAVKEAFKDFFTTHPRVESVTWTQYTPYFNDGDACHFGVGEFYVLLDSDKDEDNDEEDSYSFQDRWESYTLKSKKDPELKALGKDLEKLEDELPEDVMEAVFGDHVKVVATTKGFKVTEYEHE